MRKLALLPLVECPAISEHNLQSELNLSRNADDASDGPSRASSNRSVGQIELWRVEDVEKLSSELNFHLFRNREVLEQREIEVHAARSIENVPSRVPVLKLRGLNERSRIEPSAGSRIINSATSNSIWPAGGVHSRTRQGRCVREAALKRGNPIDLPST